jgi:hypothetical protein
VKFLVIFVLVLLELVLTFLFLVGLLTERLDDLFLGTIVGVQFLVLGLVMIFYMLMMLSPRQVAEDRNEGLLW